MTITIPISVNLVVIRTVFQDQIFIVQKMILEIAIVNKKERYCNGQKEK